MVLHIIFASFVHIFSLVASFYGFFISGVIFAGLAYLMVRLFRGGRYLLDHTTAAFNFQCSIMVYVIIISAPFYAYGYAMGYQKSSEAWNQLENYMITCIALFWIFAIFMTIRAVCIAFEVLSSIDYPFSFTFLKYSYSSLATDSSDSIQDNGSSSESKSYIGRIPETLVLLCDNEKLFKSHGLAESEKEKCRKAGLLDAYDPISGKILMDYSIAALLTFENGEEFIIKINEETYDKVDFSGSCAYEPNNNMIRTSSFGNFHAAIKTDRDSEGFSIVHFSEFMKNWTMLDPDEDPEEEQFQFIPFKLQIVP